MADIHQTIIALKHSLSLERSPAVLSALEIEIARLALLIHDHPQALLFSELAGQRAGEARAFASESAASALATRAHFHLGDAGNARVCLERALQLHGRAAPAVALTLDVAEAAEVLGETALVTRLCAGVSEASMQELELVRFRLLGSACALLTNAPEQALAKAQAAVEQTKTLGETLWHGTTLAALARAEAACDRLAPAQASFARALEVLEGGGHDHQAGEVEIEIALFVADHLLPGRPAAWWLGQALKRMQSLRHARSVERVQQLLKKHGRRLTDRQPDAQPIEDLRRAQIEMSSAQDTAHAASELVERLFTELDQAGPSPFLLHGVGAYLRQNVAENVKQTAAHVAAAARTQMSLLDTVQELLVDQDRFTDAMQTVERLVRVTDMAQLPVEIAGAVRQLIGASTVALVLREATAETTTIAGEGGFADEELREAAGIFQETGQAGAGGRGGESYAPRIVIQPLERDGHAVGVIYCKRTQGNFHQAQLRQLRRVAPFIGTLLEARRVAGERQIDARTRRATLEAISDAVLIMTDEDMLVAMNQRGELVLGNADPVSVLDYPALRELRNELHAGSTQQVDGRVVTIGQAEYLLNARSVPDSSAWVLTMTELKRAASMANTIVGSKARYTFRDIVRRSESMKRVVALAEQLAPLPTSVLLMGESGTGKELFAQSIHNGSRRHGAFVAVNCAAIPRDLLESELFGYEAGAFTGAARRGRSGKFALADAGTLFLDEVGEMPMEMQAKLLRVLQEKQVERLGADHAQPVDVRVVAATNRNLEEAVGRGLFRQDLYFRLRGAQLVIPSLRERTDDVVALVEHLMLTLPPRFGKKVNKVSSEVMQRLVQYPWPGNVRELEQALELEVSLAPPTATTIDWLPTLLEKSASPAAWPSLAEPRDGIAHTLDAEIEARERTMLIEALRRFRGSVPDVARAVGVSRATVYNKLIKYHIEAKAFRSGTGQSGR